MRFQLGSCEVEQYKTRRIGTHLQHLPHPSFSSYFTVSFAYLQFAPFPLLSIHHSFLIIHKHNPYLVHASANIILLPMRSTYATLPHGNKDQQLKWVNSHLKRVGPRVLKGLFPAIRNVPCSNPDHYRSAIKWNFAISANSDLADFGVSYQQVSRYCVV